MMQICVMLYAVVMAQISLAEYTARAMDYSFTVQSAGYACRQAEAERGLARTRLLPQLSASASASVDFRQTSGVKPFAFNITPTVLQTVYGGGGVRAEVRRADTSVDIAACNLALQELDVRYNAAAAYWTLSEALRLYAAQTRYADIVGSLRDVAKARFEDGYTGKGDLLMIEAQLSDAEYGLIVRRQSVLTAQHSFNVLLGISVDSLLLPADTLSLLPAMPERVAVDSILEARPDVRAAALEVEYARRGVDVARATYLPSLSVGVAGVLHTLTPNATGRARVDGSAVVSLSVPIWGWNASRYATSSAQAQVQSAYLSLLDLCDNVRGQQADAWSDLEMTFAQVRQSTASLEIATENLSLSTFSYTEGRTSVLDVLSAQLSWIQLYTNAIASEAAYRLAYATYMRVSAQ